MVRGRLDSSSWIVSPVFDLGCFIATAIAVVIPWLALTVWRVHPTDIVLAVAIMANGPHLVSTWTRVYLDHSERSRRPIVYLVVPLLLTGAVTAATLTGGAALDAMRTVLLYWAVWHFVSQNWGILRIYQRKSGVHLHRIATLERALLLLGALWPMTIRFRSEQLTLFGSRIAHPVLEPWVADLVGTALVLATIGYAALLARDLARGRAVSPMRPLFLAASAFAFYVPFVWIRTGSASFATAAMWHGLQYVAIVWHFNRNRWRAGTDHRAPLVSWMSQPGRTWAYVLVLFGLASASYLALRIAAAIALDLVTWSTIVWTSLTFAHYWVDGFIWKLRRPEIRGALLPT